ncbi:MAG TPA: zinc ribbon domain-containing protein [Clostridiaceae bacterium]|nr:zinc ribbon domain-containing protein [Clostridiaceae bacterium]
MYCGKCGAENSAQMDYCWSCGSPLRSGQAQQTGTYNVAPQQYTPNQAPYDYPPPMAPYRQPIQPLAKKKKKKKTALIISIVSIVLVVIVAVILFLLLGGGNKGIQNKWVVVYETSDQFFPGLILDFKKDGELIFEVPTLDSERALEVAVLVAQTKATYKIIDDNNIEVMMHTDGDTRLLKMKYKIEGDTLTFSNETGEFYTTLKRAK